MRGVTTAHDERYVAVHERKHALAASLRIEWRCEVSILSQAAAMFILKRLPPAPLHEDSRQQA
jgi:hypothetical protein